MTISLHTTQSPISRSERSKINENWNRIIAGLTNLQTQINILADGEVDELLNQLNQAVVDANIAVQQAIELNNTATQEAIDTNNAALQAALQTISISLVDLNNAITNANVATESANEATSNTYLAVQDAINATQDALTSITDMQNFVNQLSGKLEYNNDTQYLKNNIVTLNGSGYIALQNTKGNVPPDLPTISNAHWQLLAEKGEKGDKGEQGETGTGINVRGSLKSVDDLPATGDVGDAYLIDGNLYVWSGVVWEDAGNIKGPKGDKGDKGDAGATGPQGPAGADADISEITQVVTELKQTATNHFTNEDDHLQEGERDKWNKTKIDLGNHANNSELHVDAAKQQLIYDSLQANRYNNNSLINFDKNYIKKAFYTSWKTTVNSEDFNFIIPHGFGLAGSITLKVASSYSVGNAGGEAIIKYDIVAGFDGRIHWQRKTIIDLPKDTMGQRFTFSDIWDGGGGAFVITITKRAATNNPINVVFEYNSVNNNAYETIDAMTTTVYDHGVANSFTPQQSIIDQLFTSVEALKSSSVDKNTKVAQAITDKGITTSPDATGDQMAANIRAIQTGKKSLEYFVPINLNPGQQQEYVTPLGFTARNSGHQLGGQYLLLGSAFGVMNPQVVSVLSVKAQGNNIVMTVKNNGQSVYNHPGTFHFASE
ncbi:collagen-like protein [Lysinibacillus sp. NPDC096418]|uniref:collagen-like triple helix repeat-containing protein n=1 Tax=Lysinibacillus sp. NPDC096418 TaxID=3364138 RepID=UPI0038257A31